MLNANLRKAVAKWTTETGGTVKLLAEKSKVSKGTIDKWLSIASPTTPRADQLVQVCRVIGVLVESLVPEDNPGTMPVFVPFSDIIQDLNTLPDYRLDDVRRLIQPWAMEARGAAQQVIDIVEDLKVLPASRLDDVRRLVKPWAEEARRNPDSTERASATA